MHLPSVMNRKVMENPNLDCSTEKNYIVCQHQLLLISMNGKQQLRFNRGHTDNLDLLYCKMLCCHSPAAMELNVMVLRVRHEKTWPLVQL